MPVFGKSVRNKLIFIAAVTIVFVIATANPAMARVLRQDEDPPPLTQWDTYAKIFAGVVAGLGTLFGLPLTILQFKKTRVEIHKIELEAEALQAKNIPSNELWQGHRIVIDHSDNATVQILADPRFLGPLLLLLDFITAWIVLTLAGYALGTFITGLIRTSIMGLLAILLLIPIVREARRVKKVLQPSEEANSTEDDRGK